MNIPTTHLPLSALTPHPQNYNIHPKKQVAELAESLATFGQFKNIVCWTCPANMTTDDGHELHEGLTYILAGHGLWLAAMEAGLDELEIKNYSGLSYEMALALLAIDNAAPLGSEPDKERLAALLKKTQSLLDDKPGLAAMLARLKEQAGLNGKNKVNQDKPPLDKAAELQAKWQVQPGDVWELGPHRFICGDTTNKTAVETVMQGQKAALCVTSPPYFVGKDYEQQISEPEILDFIAAAAKIIAATVDPSRRIIINCATTAWSYINGGKIDYRLNLDFWQDALRAHHWFTRSIRIWSKHGGLIHNSPTGDIVDMHWEFLATFYNPTAPHRGQNRVGEGWSMAGIWDGIHGEKQEFHSAPFPVVIPARFIELYTDPGELVFEPFLGSGTTLMAAQQLGRRCAGVELEPKYGAVVLERWLNLTGIEPHKIAHNETSN